MVHKVLKALKKSMSENLTVCGVLFTFFSLVFFFLVCHCYFFSSYFDVCYYFTLFDFDCKWHFLFNPLYL